MLWRRNYYTAIAQQTKTREEHKIIWFILHERDPSISRDNSHVVEVNVDDLIMGPSFYTVSLFHKMNMGFLHEETIFLPST